MSLTNGSPSEAARAAKLSSRTLAILSTEDRNSALQSIHDALSAAKSDILNANARDLEIATKSAADGELSQSILKRLDLSRPGKFEDMLKGILDVKGLDDPGMFSDRGCAIWMCLLILAVVGKVDMRTELDDGLILQRQSCPIGVLLIIFEARPEVIANIASLAIKSANAAILKGLYSTYVVRPPKTNSTNRWQGVNRIIQDYRYSYF